MPLYHHYHRHLHSFHYINYDVEKLKSNWNVPAEMKQVDVGMQGIINYGLSVLFVRLFRQTRSYTYTLHVIFTNLNIWIVFISTGFCSAIVLFIVYYFPGDLIAHTALVAYTQFSTIEKSFARKKRTQATAILFWQ